MNLFNKKKSVALALSISLTVIVSGAYVAQAETTQSLTSQATTIASEIASGFGATFGDIPSRIAERLDNARINSRAKFENVAIYVAPDISSVRMVVEKMKVSYPASALVVSSRVHKNDSAVSIKDSFVGAYVALGENVYSAITSFLSGYSSFIEKSGERVLAAVEPALSDQQTKPSIYGSVRNFFGSANRALTNFFTSSPPAPLVTDGKDKPPTQPAAAPKPSAITTVTPASSLPTSPELQRGEQPQVSNSYTTVIQGVSPDFMEKSLASLKADILASVSNTIRPISAQNAQNVQTIQMVSRIEDLSNLIVRNGDFRNSIFDNGVRVSATGGNFTNLTGGTTSLGATTITGALTLASALAVSSGGTGWAAISSGAIPYGNGSSALATTTAGTSGYVLALNGTTPTWVATTTFSSGLTYSNGNVTNTGVLSLGPTGSALTGALVFATSSTAFNGLTASTTVTGSGTTLTFANTLAGLLGVAGGGTGLSSVSDGQLLFGSGGTSALTALATTSNAGRFLTLDYTTGRPAWTATSTLFGTGTGGQVLAWNNGAPQFVATTTFSSGLAYSAGNVTNTGVLSLGPTGSALTGALVFATSSTAFNGLTASTTVTGSGTTLTFANTLAGLLGVAGGGTGLSSVSDGQLLFGSGGTSALTALATTSNAGRFLTLDYTTGRPSWVATSSLNVALSNTTGTLGVGSGGTGATTLTGLLQGNGTGAITAVTGTVGQFAYFNGTNTLTATSSIYLATTQNVGIGTTTPLSKLSISGSASIGADYNIAAPTNGLIVQGNLGVGTTTPWLGLSVTNTSASGQFVASYDNGNYATLAVDAVGDLKFTAKGGDIRALSENLWVCDNAACPTLTATSTAGNIFVENAITFGNGFSMASTSNVAASELGLYGAGGGLIVIFDNGL